MRQRPVRRTNVVVPDNIKVLTIHQRYSPIEEELSKFSLVMVRYSEFQIPPISPASKPGVRGTNSWPSSAPHLLFIIEQVFSL